MSVLPSVVSYCMHTFIGSLLGEDSVVVDLGANRGEFAFAIARKFGCVVHAVEPVPHLAAMIPAAERIRTHRICISSETGSAPLALIEGHGGRLAHLPAASTLEAEPVEETRVESRAYRLEEFLSKEGVTSVALLKMDIEGAELDVLSTTPESVLLEIKQITVEFHDWLWPHTTLQVEEVMARLRNLGFRRIRFSRTNGDVLFVRSDLLGTLQHIYVATVVKYGRGVARVVRRQLARSQPSVS